MGRLVSDLLLLAGSDAHAYSLSPRSVDAEALLSDLYARRGRPAQTPLGRLDSRESLENRLLQSGLAPALFEDHTAALTALCAGALMSGEGCALSQALRGPDWPEGVKTGYYLCTAQKGEA